VVERIPDVTLEDLDRIVARDFPADQRGTVVAFLGHCESGIREANRVRAAVLKLADGRVELLGHYVDRAVSDYRDVLFWAEYPTVSQDENWRQYQEWFNR
jgi:hypothetical protein